MSGFYPTPRTVVLLMLARAGSIQIDDSVLEPSAGSGAIADVIREFSNRVEVVEPDTQLAFSLREKGYAPHECRFEDFIPSHGFLKIVMNPPFAGGKDLLHIRRAFELLLPGGTLVSLMNAGTDEYDSTQEQKKEFSDWLMGSAQIDSVTVEAIPQHLFLSKENVRPSRVPIEMITIQKRSEPPPETHLERK